MIRAAGCLILNAKGQALFLQRGPGSDYPGMWSVPGGRREGEETAQETAIRETEEECGLKLNEKDLQFWTRSERPQEASPLVTPPQGETVDFTTFLVKKTEDFEVKLNEQEHTGYAWADINNPPSPLHPGCAIALRRFSMDDELQVAEAIRDGELVSPQEYGNIFLFALRISGVGTAVRGEKKNEKGEVTQKAEVVYRKPEDYTSQEFLTRAQGLPVVIMHPDEAILDTKQFYERSVGAIMITYLRPHPADGSMEPWGVARVYDHDAALALCEMDLSTSPGVLLGKDARTLTLEGGTQVIIEGKPKLLDHLAICPNGVWDKGEGPTGVDNIHSRGDSIMKVELARIAGETDQGYAARVQEAERLLVKHDSVNKGSEDKLDKLLAGITGVGEQVKLLNSRVDSMEEKEKKDAEEEETKKKADAKGRLDAFEFPKKDKKDSEEEFKKKMDAAEKACMDAAMESGMPEEAAVTDAKKRRHDAEDIDKKEEEEAKSKADAEAEKEKEKMDAKKDATEIADLRKSLAALQDQVKGAIAGPGDSDRAKLLEAQGRFDSVHRAFGKQAEPPLLGDKLHEYRLRNLRALQAHSPAWKDKPLELVAVNDSLLDTVEQQILADAVKAAANPTEVEKGTLYMRSRQDNGHITNEWFGETAAWMRPLAGPVGQRARKWVDPSPGAKRGH